MNMTWRSSWSVGQLVSADFDSKEKIFGLDSHFKNGSFEIFDFNIFGDDKPTNNNLPK